MTAALGTTAVFRVVAVGRELRYQWQYKIPTGGWKNNSSATVGYNTDTLQVAASNTRNGYQYRCVVTDADGSTVTSDPATLTVRGGTNSLLLAERQWNETEE